MVVPLVIIHFFIGFTILKPSSYWGTPTSGNPHFFMMMAVLGGSTEYFGDVKPLMNIRIAYILGSSSD